jgi:type I restriction enzyme R subunit
VDEVLHRMVFNPAKLTELTQPLGLGWKARVRKEVELMKSLAPLLKKLAQGREISGLEVYEHV